MRSLIVCCAGLMFSGCSLFPSVSESIAENVDKYCRESSAVERTVISDSINNTIAPHHVELVCATDTVRK